MTDNITVKSSTLLPFGIGIRYYGLIIIEVNTMRFII